MHPIEFASPELFMNYFISHRSLSLGPNKPLVIKNIESFMASGVLNDKLSGSSKIIYAHYFLNRIVLPLGITLQNESPDQPLLQIDEGVATFTNNRESKLRAKNGPILTSIRDLVIRMIQAGRHVFTIPKGERLFIAGIPPEEIIKVQQFGTFGFLFAPYCSLGNVISLRYCFLGKVFNSDNNHVMELELTDDFRLEFHRKFEYDSPSMLGQAISTLGGFTLPAGATLKVEDVRDQTFLDLEEKGGARAKWITLFFDRCLAIYGLKVKTLTYGGEIEWAFEDSEDLNNTFTIKSTEDLVVTTTKSDDFVVEIKTLAWDLCYLKPSERKLTISSGQRVTFFLTGIPQEKMNRINRYFSEEYTERDEDGKKLGADLFATTGIVGLSWEVIGTRLGFGAGTYQPLDKPTVYVRTESELTLKLVPSGPAELIIDIINNGPVGLRKAFLEQDTNPKIHRYILFQIFMRIIGGSLTDFSSEELEVLDLKEGVLDEIDRLRSDEDFNRNKGIVKRDHFAEVSQICNLGPEDLDEISVDSYPTPVQTLLKAAFALISAELSGSEILTTHSLTAKQSLE